MESKPNQLDSDTSQADGDSQDQAATSNPPNSDLSPPNTNHHTLRRLLIILAVTAVSSLGFIYYKLNQTPTPVTTEETSLHQALSEPSIEEIALTDIEYHSQIELLEFSSQTYRTELVKVGKLNQAPYQNGDLILARVYDQKPCKGAACGLPKYNRYIFDDGNLIFLPNASEMKSTSLETTQVRTELNATLTNDPRIELPDLEIYNQLTDQADGRKLPLTFVDQIETEWRPDQLQIAFTEQQSEQVYYTTKPELSRQASFYFDEEVELGAQGRFCPGEECLLTNGFYTLRPDGTILIYKYQVETSDSEIFNYNQTDYLPYTSYGCSQSAINFANVIHPKQDLSEMTQISTWNNLPVYLPNSDHSLINNFYLRYQVIADHPIYQDQQDQILSKNQFINQNPILIWQDSFDRQIQLVRRDLLPPRACEPIIYIYADQPTPVNLKLEPKIHQSLTIPNYPKTGWQIQTLDSRKLLNLDDMQTYDFLFWEGRSSLIPKQNQGYLLASTEVSDWLDQALSQRGLIQNEIDDLKSFWLAKLTQDNYVKISFIDQETIDQVYPLTVSPEPETVIRVYFEYQTLETPIEVQTPKAPKQIERHGLTLVEWGGLER